MISKFILWLTLCATVSAQYNVIEASEDDRERELQMYRLLYSGSDAKLDKVLAELGSLKSEVSNLQKQLNSQSKKKGCRDDVTKNYIVQNCGNNTQRADKDYVIEALRSERGLCRVIIPEEVTGKSYRISAWLQSIVGPRGKDSGSVGFAYNVKDGFNFDFIYLRLHHPQTCFRTGYVQNGRTVWIGRQTGLCPEGPPKGRKWFKLELKVDHNSAALKLEGIQIANIVPHFNVLGRGGVVVGISERNVVKFRHYEIEPIDTSSFQFSSCKYNNRISQNYYLIQGSPEGEWPRAGFCRAISKSFIRENHYMLSASLYNQVELRGKDTGLLGIVFNVQNEYNYDFVYFRPTSVGGCFTTGFVQNSQLQWSNSRVGACTGGPRKHAEWFNVTIFVSDQSVSISAAGKHVVTTNAHFSPIGRGGVIVANGNQNAVAFRDYKVEPAQPHTFTFHNCAAETKEIGGYYILDAAHGDWPESTFCKAVHRDTKYGKFYFIAANLFMQGTSVGSDTDYAGLMFNVKNENNYDFIMLTPHDYKSCFKAGFVLNGAIQWSSILEGKCPGNQIKVGKWLKLEVTVSDADAMISLNGRHLISYKLHYPARGKGGVIVGNGFRNILSFRDFSLYEMIPTDFRFYSCGGGTHFSNKTVVMDASLPRGGSLTFCRAIYGKSLSNNFEADQYSIQASFYNVDSWQGGDWGRVGLIYNAKDEANYDFVFLNILTATGECYQYGHVFNGVLNLNRGLTGKCDTDPPARKWFDLKVVVSKTESQVEVLLQDATIAKIKPTLPYLTKGGVLVPNGFRNLVMFRNFVIKKGVTN